MIGKCKLCLRDDVELRSSHILPAALYRLLRVTAEGKNPNPVLISEGVEIQTSYQERAQLFCQNCEQRLSAQGERWVFGHGQKADGSFPLASYLAESVGRAWPDVPEELYFAAAIPRVNASAIAYFAASIFWRSSIHPYGKSEMQVNLGPFEEAFRAYLIGESDFPAHAVLIVTARPISVVSALVEWPSRLKLFDGMRVYSFVMPGFGFKLFVSRNISSYIAQLCFVRGNNNPMLFSDVLEIDLAQRARKALMGSVSK